MGTLLVSIGLLAGAFILLALFGKWAEYQQQVKAAKACDEHEKQLDYYMAQEYAQAYGRAYAEAEARQNYELQMQQQLALQHYARQQQFQHPPVQQPRIVEGYVVSDG